MNILINSTVLSNFAAVGRLMVLRNLYGTLYLAEAVYEEAQNGLEQGYTFLAGLDEHIFPFHPNGWLHLVNLEGEDELTCYKHVPSKIHRGEAVSLAIAAHRTSFEAKERQKIRQRAHLAALDTLFAALQHRAFAGEL